MTLKELAELELRDRQLHRMAQEQQKLQMQMAQQMAMQNSLNSLAGFYGLGLGDGARNAYAPPKPTYEHSYQNPESDDYDPLRVIRERSP